MKLLIIDNDAGTVITLKALLTSYENFDIDVAYSGQEGLDKMTTFPNYDVVLIDIMMPEISGIELCKMMTKNYKLSKIPVILMSSAIPMAPDEYSQMLARDNSLTVIKGVIEKPFIGDELVKKIHQIAFNNRKTKLA